MLMITIAALAWLAHVAQIWCDPTATTKHHNTRSTALTVSIVVLAVAFINGGAY